MTSLSVGESEVQTGGLVVVAEEHSDEFRAVAQYLNAMVEHDSERGIAVWLVEAKAVRIGDSPWAPLFSTVVEPNSFTATVEQAKQTIGPLASVEDFWYLFATPSTLNAAKTLHTKFAHGWFLPVVAQTPPLRPCPV